MDILTHTISGMAAGTVVSGFSKKGSLNKAKIIAVSGFAGAFPDIDAISLWSKFDSTIGKAFNLPYSGKYIYSAKLWYSHHGFFHSLLAGILFALLIGLLAYIINCRFKKLNSKKLINNYISQKLILIGFISGFIIHLLEDMPTPASAWGGVNLFWPLKSYIGGTGYIWWWNNYDIFLIVSGVFVINLIFIVIRKFFRFNLWKFVTGIFTIGFTFVIIQIHTRNYDFAYSGHTNRYMEFEAKSKELQKEILGEKTYKLMEKLDNRLPIHF